MNIKPLSDRVLVEPAAAETKTAGGIYIPDTAKEKPQKGTVIAVGPGKKDEPTTNDTSPSPTNSDSTYLKLSVNNGNSVYHYDANAIISSFDTTVMTIQCFESFPTYPDAEISGLPIKVKSGQTIVDTIGNPLKGDFLTINIHYRLGTDPTTDIYVMRYPLTLTVDRHDTVTNNIKGNFEGTFERTTSDTLLIKGEFNVFY